MWHGVCTGHHGTWWRSVLRWVPGCCKELEHLLLVVDVHGVLLLRRLRLRLDGHGARGHGVRSHSCGCGISGGDGSSGRDTVLWDISGGANAARGRVCR